MKSVSGHSFGLYNQHNTQEDLQWQWSTQNVSKKEMKELWSVINMPYVNNISPLGLVIAGTLMKDLEMPLILTLTEYITLWKWYVDDTIAVIKLTSIAHVLSILNSFHQNIEFICELEQNDKINFLDDSLIRMNDTLQTTIYRKSTHNDVYLHWNVFASRIQKNGTLRTTLIQAYKICSTNEILQNKLKQIEKEFIKINGYLKWVFDQVNVECKHPRNIHYNINVTTNNASINTAHRLIPLHQGEQGQKLLSQLTNASKDYHQKIMH